MTNTTQNIIDWEKEFDVFFREDGFSTEAETVKEFIRSLLSTAITTAKEGEREQVRQDLGRLYKHPGATDVGGDYGDGWNDCIDYAVELLAPSTLKGNHDH